MAFCSKCGATLAGNAGFCTSCGTPNGTPGGAPQQFTGMQGTGKMHCPQCRSHNISPINESSITGGLTTHHGGMSATSFSNQQRAFWMCADCGAKFRSIPSLEEEIRKTKSQPIIWTIFAILGFLLTLYIGINLAKPFGAFFLLPSFAGALIATILFFIFIFVSRSKLKKMRAELEYLKINCFN